MCNPLLSQNMEVKPRKVWDFLRTTQVIEVRVGFGSLGTVTPKALSFARETNFAWRTGRERGKSWVGKRKKLLEAVEGKVS